MPYRVFKYPVPITDTFSIAIPQSGQILDVQVQQGTPVMWALVNPDAPKMERQFRLLGTGHPIEAEERYQFEHIATFQLDEGTLVFHLFEVVPTSWP